MDKIQVPYEHDCKSCKWVGWLTDFSLGKNDLANVYICKKSIIIRFGDKPEEYISMRMGLSQKGNIKLCE